MTTKQADNLDFENSSRLLNLPTPLTDGEAANKAYVDTVATGLLDFRGEFNASGNAFPSTGGSGTGGAIKKADIWIVSVGGTLGGNPVQAGDWIVANVDSPGQMGTNWSTLNSNITYTPEDAANKVTSLSGSSTDVQYPSAKLVYDQLAGKQPSGSYEVTANKSSDIVTDGGSTTKYPTVKAIKDYADGLVAGLLDFRGAYNASGNVFPSAGGSGTAGAVLKGDVWIVSVAGTLGGSAVQIGDWIVANVDSPGQTSGNWNTLNTNIVYVPEDSANKVASLSGNSTDTEYPSAKVVYVGLSGKSNYHGIQAAGNRAWSDSEHTYTVDSITYWYKGVKCVSSSPIVCDLDLTADRDNSSSTPLQANTLYFLYFKDTTGKLYWSDTPWNFTEHVFVATVFWNGSLGAPQRELHSYTRNLDWHMNAHLSIGARYGGGLDLTYPNAANDTLLRVETGTVYDEDQPFTTGQQTVMRGWHKVSANVYTFTNYSLPYLGTSGQPQYVDTDTYALTNVGASDFACYFVYASLDDSRPIYVIPTTAATAHNTLALARAEAIPNLKNLNVNHEMKLLYKLIYKGDGEWQETVDYRESSPLPGAGSASTTAGSVSFLPYAGISSTTVQAAIQELEDEKQQKLADPGANTLWGWDETDNAVVAIVLGSGISYDHATHTLSVSASPGGVPTQITIANEATDTTCFPLFAVDTTGDKQPKTNPGLTFNSATGNLGATTFNELTLSKQTTGFTVAGGTTSKTLTVSDTAEVSGTNSGDSAKNTLVSTIIYVIDNGASAITTGIKGDLQIPFACTINSWTLLADQSGSVVVDIWKDTLANYPPTVADTITASAKPTLSNATNATSSTLTGWTTNIAAGDTLRFNIDSVSTIQRLTLMLKVTKT